MFSLLVEARQAQGACWMRRLGDFALLWLNGVISVRVCAVMNNQISIVRNQINRSEVGVNLTD